MKTLFALLAFSFILLFAGCKEETPVQPKIQTQGWYEVTDTNYIFIPQCRQWPTCEWYNDTNYVRLPPSDIDPDSICFRMDYAINDTIQYKTLIQQSVFPQCELPYIDFSRYTLLGLYINFSYGGKILSKNIMINDTSKLCTYRISILDTDKVYSSIQNYLNWVLIPKLPNDYKVEFKRHRTRNM